MRCPSEIADLLLRILSTAVLRARSFGWSGEAARCAVEMDHVHNLPELLIDYHPDRLRYYWEVERPSFIKQSGETDSVFRAAWDRLAALLSSEPLTAGAVATLPS